MKNQRPPQAVYALQSVERACDVLSCLSQSETRLTLSEISRKVGLSQPTVFRILQTLLAKGFVEQPERFHYASRIRLPQSRSRTVGYAAQSTEFAFSRAVTESIRRAAHQECFNLIEVNNRYSRKVALKNANQLIRQGVELVIEFQTDEQIAPVLMSLYATAGIPVIAVEIPHPGATYFGADNYTAGLIGGEGLGLWAKNAWSADFGEILLLELPLAGPLPASRLTGFLEGLYRVIPESRSVHVTRLNGNGQFGKTLEVVRKHLRTAPCCRTLIAGINDPSTIGAVRAFEECGRASDCAAMGFNASLEARIKMRRLSTRLVGSVAFFPERYGEEIIPLARKILDKRSAPLAVFMKHRLVTPSNVGRLYPNDNLLADNELDSLMLQAPPERP